MTTVAGLPQGGGPLLETVRRFAFPRAAGTEGDAEIRRLLTEPLRAAGFTVREAPFEFHPAGPVRRLRLALATAAATLLLHAVEPPSAADGTSLLARSLLLLAAAAGVVLSIYWSDGFFSGRSEGVETANLLARGGEPGARLLVVLAHHDSKSQHVTVVVRTVMIAVGLIGVAAFAADVILRVALAAQPALWSHALRIAAGAGGAAFAVLAPATFGNRSPGALDNAGSLAVALELARRVAARPVEAAEIQIVFPGAEEQMMAGARALARDHAEEWHRRGAVLINLDGVGGPGPVGVEGPRDLVRQALEAANQAGVQASRLRLPLGTMTDALPLRRAGLPVLTLTSGTLSPAVRAVHTPRDRPENLDEQRLGDAAGLVEGLVRRLARERP